MNEAEKTVRELLARHGWALPEDITAREIVLEAVGRWGLDDFAASLERALATDEPQHCLESYGRALGARWECPRQLVRLGTE